MYAVFRFRRHQGDHPDQYDPVPSAVGSGLFIQRKYRMVSVDCRISLAAEYLLCIYPAFRLLLVAWKKKSEKGMHCFFGRPWHNDRNICFHAAAESDLWRPYLAGLQHAFADTAGEAAVKGTALCRSFGELSDILPDQNDQQWVFRRYRRVDIPLAGQPVQKYGNSLFRLSECIVLLSRLFSLIALVLFVSDRVFPLPYCG